VRHVHVERRKVSDAALRANGFADDINLSGYDFGDSGGHWRKLMLTMTESNHIPLVPLRATAPGYRGLMTRARWVEVARIVFVGVVTVLYWQDLLPFEVLLGGVAVGLYPLAKDGILDLLHLRKVGTQLFVTVATVVAVVGGEYIAASVLMTIILIAEFIADFNTGRARASIQALIGSVPQTALIRKDGIEHIVSITELQVGDIVLVRAGEKIPVDGTVAGGEGSVNEAPITGESLPVDKGLGADVLAGTVVESGALDIRTDKVGGDTLFARIVKLVAEAEESTAPVEKLTDRVAAWLIPVVFIFLIAVYIFTQDVRLIVTLLIFTSPAELGLATPIVMIAAIARAAQSGILVKGAQHLELLAKADAFVFDKTGTLTMGQPRIVSIEVATPEVTEDMILAVAASADRRSAHPLAQAIVAHAVAKNIKLSEPTAFETIRGRGVVATIDGEVVLAGNAALLTEHGVSIPNTGDAASANNHVAVPGTNIYVAVAGRAVGIISLADVVRPGAREAITQLKASGVKHIVMLTGDNLQTARHVASELGVDEVMAELLPEDKVNAIQALQADGHRVVMVGDGVNDAPALAHAHVGIAMGARGTQAAIEAADIALMTDDLSKIVLARSLARRAYRTIKENLIVGVGIVHVLGITAALLGLIGPVEAALLHMGPDILVFLNSMKLLRVRL